MHPTPPPQPPTPQTQSKGIKTRHARKCHEIVIPCPQRIQSIPSHSIQNPRNQNSFNNKMRSANFVPYYTESTKFTSLSRICPTRVPTSSDQNADWTFNEVPFLEKSLKPLPTISFALVQRKKLINGTETTSLSVNQIGHHSPQHPTRLFSWENHTKDSGLWRGRSAGLFFTWRARAASAAGSSWPSSWWGRTPPPAAAAPRRRSAGTRAPSPRPQPQPPHRPTPPHAPSSPQTLTLNPSRNGNETAPQRKIPRKIGENQGKKPAAIGGKEFADRDGSRWKILGGEGIGAEKMIFFSHKVFSFFFSFWSFAFNGEASVKREKGKRGEWEERSKRRGGRAGGYL